MPRPKGPRGEVRSGYRQRERQDQGHMPLLGSEGRVLWGSQAKVKNHLDVQHKVCGRVGNEGDQGRKNGSVSTWKESVTKKVVFGFMGNEPSPAGLCAR